MGHELQTTSTQPFYDSLQQSIDACKYSNHCLSETMSAVHEAIRENHLVVMPSKLVGKESDYFELETEPIEGYCYHVLYEGYQFGKSYDINIVRISKCLPEEIEYKIQRKVEKQIHDQLLNRCDLNYFDKHFEDPGYDLERREGEKGNY